MQPASLGFRTDLALLVASGSEIEEQATHLIVRTPDNPASWWGNFLLLPTPPAEPAEVGHWTWVFEQAFPSAEHRTIGIDAQATPESLGSIRTAGYGVLRSAVLTTRAIPIGGEIDPAFEVRPLASDEDWAQQVRLSLAGEVGAMDLDFALPRARAHRLLVEAGQGAWYGGFLDGTLLASLGVFAATGGLARFQSVKTHPQARGRGLAGRLLSEAGRYALTDLGAERLVIVVDPARDAARLYRRLGFVDTEVQVQCERPAG